MLEGIREHVSQLSPEELKVYLGQPENEVGQPENEVERAARKKSERNARARGTADKEGGKGEAVKRSELDPIPWTV